MNEDENVIWRGLEARIERLEDIVRELDEILRGDRKSKIVGMLAEWNRHDYELRKLNAVVFVDSTGKRGIAHDVDVLMDRRSGQEKDSQLKWGFWTAILVALISATTAIVTNWDKVQKAFPRLPQTELQKLHQRSRPTKKITTVRYRVVPATETSLSGME